MSVPLLSGLQDFVDSVFHPDLVSPVPAPEANDPSQMKLTMVHGPTQDLSQTMAAQPPSTGGFKFQMGKKSYSDVADQVKTAIKGTPLEPYADQFIAAGEKYGVDPRVLPTIANNESSLGKNYPTDSYNPFGYLVNPTTGHGVSDVYTGLRNAGFTSLPMAIDRLTGRFARQPTSGYQQFYQDPTVDNLQAAYNGNPAEKDNYIKNGSEFVSQFH